MTEPGLSVVPHCFQEGYTPLHYALQDASRLSLALVLVGAGADPLHRATGGGADRPLDRTGHPSHKLSLLRTAVGVAQERLAKLQLSEAGSAQDGQSLASKTAPSAAGLETPLPGSLESPQEPQQAQPGDRSPQPTRATSEEGPDASAAAPATAQLTASSDDVAPPSPTTPATAAPAAAWDLDAGPLPPAVAAAQRHLQALRDELAKFDVALPRSTASEPDIPSPRFGLGSSGRTPLTAIRLVRATQKWNRAQCSPLNAAACRRFGEATHHAEK